MLVDDVQVGVELGTVVAEVVRSCRRRGTCRILIEDHVGVLDLSTGYCGHARRRPPHNADTTTVLAGMVLRVEALDGSEVGVVEVEFFGCNRSRRHGHEGLSHMNGEMVVSRAVPWCEAEVDDDEGSVRQR